MKNGPVDRFDGRRVQRRAGLPGCTAQHLLLPPRGAHGRMELLLDESHFAHHLRPLVEQLYDLAVNRVDALPGRFERLGQVGVLSEKGNGGQA